MAMALFAMAAVMLASAYLNVLNGYETAGRAAQLNENFAFEDLRAFAAVARLRSMSKAALALDTTQSTVSKRVQRLEQMLGLQLVDRQTRPIGLTVEGRTFQRLVGGFLESVDAMTQGARDRRRHRQGGFQG